MARCVAAIFNLAERRLFNSAAIYGNGTPCVKSATRRRVDRSRHVTAEDDTLLLRGRIRYGHCPQQCLCVGVFGGSADLSARSHFDELAEIHDSDPGRNVLDHRYRM